MALEQRREVQHLRHEKFYQLVVSRTVKEARELNMTKNDDFVGLEENGQFGYTSIHGELPKFDLKRNKTSSVYSAASNRPWETIFSGSSHV